MLLFVAASLTASAQIGLSEPEHLTFKGVPIDGSLSEFVVKLKAAGFIPCATEQEIAVLKGDFAGYKNCVVSAQTIKPKDLVDRVKVVFPGTKMWPALFNNYTSLKRMLTKKYGEPTACIEEFYTFYQPELDDMKICAVQFDKSKFLTTFNTQKGEIQLSIGHKGMNCFPVLHYFDKINTESVQADALDDL